MPTYKAFVSSTFRDLKNHRNHVIRALRQAGFFVDPMEDWTASTDEPKQFSQERVKGCHLCILLVGLRRGHIPRGKTLSITQLELKAALELGLDVLVFMLEEQAPWPREYDELDKDPALRRWREDLKEHKGVGFFSYNPETIQIAPALTRWIAEKSTWKTNENRSPFANEITESTLRFLLAIQRAERRAIKQEDYDAAYQQWEVNKAKIENQFRSHLRDSPLVAEWTSLAKAVTDLYRLSGTWSEPYRSKVLNELKEFFSAETTDWDCLRDHKKKWVSNENFQQYFGAWWELRDAARLRSEGLARKLLE